MVNCTVFSILYFSLKPQLKNEVLATISDKILWVFQKVCLKFPLSPYTMLQTDNIA